MTDSLCSGLQTTHAATNSNYAQKHDQHNTATSSQTLNLLVTSRVKSPKLHQLFKHFDPQLAAVPSEEWPPGFDNHRFLIFISQFIYSKADTELSTGARLGKVNTIRAHPANIYYNSHCITLFDTQQASLLAGVWQREDLDGDLNSIQSLMQDDPTTLKDTIPATASLLQHPAINNTASSRSTSVVDVSM